MARKKLKVYINLYWSYLEWGLGLSHTRRYVSAYCLLQGRIKVLSSLFDISLEKVFRSIAFVAPFFLEGQSLPYG